MSSQISVTFCNSYVCCSTSRSLSTGRTQKENKKERGEERIVMLGLMKCFQPVQLRSLDSRTHSLRMFQGRRNHLNTRARSCVPGEPYYSPLGAHSNRCTSSTIIAKTMVFLNLHGQPANYRYHHAVVFSLGVHRSLPRRRALFSLRHRQNDTYLGTITKSSPKIQAISAGQEFGDRL